MAVPYNSRASPYFREYAFKADGSPMPIWYPSRPPTPGRDPDSVPGYREALAAIDRYDREFNSFDPFPRTTSTASVQTPILSTTSILSHSSVQLPKIATLKLPLPTRPNSNTISRPKKQDSILPPNPQTPTTTRIQPSIPNIPSLLSDSSVQPPKIPASTIPIPTRTYSQTIFRPKKKEVIVPPNSQTPTATTPVNSFHLPDLTIASIPTIPTKSRISRCSSEYQRPAIIQTQPTIPTSCPKKTTKSAIVKPKTKFQPYSREKKLRRILKNFKA